MPTPIGHIEALYRYPVKSMRGESLDPAGLGWHGLEGDRRLALRRLDDRGEFPWLTAGKLPGLILYTPDLPAHIRTPDGDPLPPFGDALAADVERRHGAPVQMMQLRHGVFDDATVSVIATDTVCEIARLSGRAPDVRRFRPNIVLRLCRPTAFQEDEWLGRVLSFGDAPDAPAIAVTMRDLRCGMVNLDPDTAAPTPEVLKAIARANHTNAGIYATVTRTGRLSPGQPVFLL